MGDQAGQEGFPPPAKGPLSHRLEEALRRWAPLLSARLGLHLAVALIVTAVSLAKGSWFGAPRSLVMVSAEASAEYEIPSGFNVQPLESGGFLLRAPLPRTIIPLRPRETLVTYVVQPDDTLYGIAEKFGISADTIAWANSALEERPNLLSTGMEIIIPPTSGVLHTVQAGETLESIARKYKATISSITEYSFNRLGDPPVIQVGQKVMVPSGVKPPPPTPVPTPRPTPRPTPVPTPKAPVPTPVPKAPTPLGRGRFVWPASGTITQVYWARHRAIDIAAPKGTPIYASDSGVVTVAGLSDIGYGYYIVIDHGNGFQTLYAHLSWYDVDAGARVVQGQRIGLMGSTGYSTGPHLHFEIILNGVQQNPYNYLGR